MAGSDFLLPMAAGAVLSCASYVVVTHVVSKRQISSLRAISWRMLGTLSLVLGMCAFATAGAEHPAEKQGSVCSDSTPECYAKTHHNPINECKQTLDKKATFRHVWLENEVQPAFNTYLWHDKNKHVIQIFGQQAKVINGLGMLAPLQYFCIFNADTGNVIAAAFE